MVKTKNITNILMEEIFVYILLRKVRNKKKVTEPEREGRSRCAGARTPYLLLPISSFIAGLLQGFRKA